MLTYQRGDSFYQSFEQYLRYINGDKKLHLHYRPFLKCGLPALWLYLRELGIEESYFKQLKNVIASPWEFKHIVYAINFVNSAQKFFPVLPNIVRDKMSPEVRAAQIARMEPDFSLPYAFSLRDLTDTLRAVLLPGRGFLLGDHSNAAAMVNDNGTYYLYYAGLNEPRQYNDIDGLVAGIGNYFKFSNDEVATLLLQSFMVAPGLEITPDNEILRRLLEQNKVNNSSLLNALKFAVQTSDLTAIQLFEQYGVPLDRIYAHELDLLYLAWQAERHDLNHPVTELLVSLGVRLSHDQRDLYRKLLPAETFADFTKVYDGLVHSTQNKPSYDRPSYDM